MATREELAELDAELGPHRDARLATGKPDPAGRTGGQRDTDRILYSQAFRRLGGVTQVVAVNETQLFHTRLTHSLKVAQIGQRLAQTLRQTTSVDRLRAAGGIDPDVVFAAALAHDLGHPPYGHVAEDELQKLLAGEPPHSDHGPVPGLDSFEGNAQSFRIVTKLAWRSDDPLQPGLNLTRATLAAVLKYPWLKKDAPADKLKKWGAYESEGPQFKFAVERPDGSAQPAGWRSPEAVIMDWSDDIAYAVHDLEDFYRAGLIPLDRLRSNPREARRLLSRICGRLNGKDDLTSQGLEEAFERLQSKDLPIEPYFGTRAQQAGLSQLASTLITRFAEAVSITAGGAVHIPDGVRHEVAVLKQLTFYYMIDNPALATLQAGQRTRVAHLYYRLREWADGVVTGAGPVSSDQLPAQLTEILRAIRTDTDATDAYESHGDETLRARAVVDYVTGLTEAQVVDLHDRFTGASSGSALAGWLRI